MKPGRGAGRVTLAVAGGAGGALITATLCPGPISIPSSSITGAGVSTVTECVVSTTAGTEMFTSGGDTLTAGTDTFTSGGWANSGAGAGDDDVEGLVVVVAAAVVVAPKVARGARWVVVTVMIGGAGIVAVKMARGALMTPRA